MQKRYYIVLSSKLLKIWELWYINACWGPGWHWLQMFPIAFNSAPLAEPVVIFLFQDTPEHTQCSKDSSPGGQFVCHQCTRQRQEWIGLKIWFDSNNTDLMRSEESEPGLQIPSVSYFYNRRAKTLNPHSSELWSQILQLESITSKWWLLAQLLQLKAGIHNSTLNEGDVLQGD